MKSMKIILAQGNPGAEYAQTRHNVGWMIVNQLAEQHKAAFGEQAKFHSYVAPLQIGDEKVLLVKPTTFYNETGRSARALVDFYKLDPSQDFLAIHDDIGLPLGSVRVRQQGSGGGNNGIKSLNAHLGADYWRIRVGIWTEKKPLMRGTDFVLGKLLADEKAIVQGDVFDFVTKQIDLFCRGEIAADSLPIAPTKKDTNQVPEA